MIFYRIFFVFFLFSLQSIYSQNDNDFVKLINAHIRIRDYSSAIDEAQQALHLFPHSKPLWNVYIRALAKKGDEKEMISVWNNYVEVFPEEKENRELTEILAWGVLEHASHSSSPIIRLMSLLSAFLSQDSKGIKIMVNALRDPNSAIRGAAAQLSSNFFDDDLKDEIYYLFHNETVWNVRLEIIHAMGAMKMREVQDELLALLKSSNTTAEEIVIVVEALVNMLDRATREDVIKLSESNRAGLRLLACQVVAHFEMRNCVDLIVPLIDDHNADVRKAALWVMGYLRIGGFKENPPEEFVKKRLKDNDPYVAMKAAWLLMLSNPKLGQQYLKPWLNHENRDVRIAAAAHLATSGKHAFPLIEEQFQISKDPYVRMNLAIGLLGQRVLTQEACTALYDGLITIKDKWTWDESNHVRALGPSKLRHTDDLNNSPETIDQITRLEVLNILAMMKFTKAQQAIKAFLQQKTWGITAMAAATLLTEGDEAALDIVQALMNDSDTQVRVQSALILALWGGGGEALETLSKAYATADREMKERILEGIIKISSPESISFLLERLQEPNQSLRVMAAAGLILCLYH